MLTGFVAGRGVTAAVADASTSRNAVEPAFARCRLHAARAQRREQRSYVIPEGAALEAGETALKYSARGKGNGCNLRGRADSACGTEKKDTSFRGEGQKDAANQ